jgi:hypothetical protein
VWDTRFKVDGAACVVSVNGGRYSATKAWDQQGNRFRQVAERIGRQFIGLQPYRASLPSAQGAAVKDEQ